VSSETQTMRIAGDPQLVDLGPERPSDTQTAWQDPWAATRAVSRETPYVKAIRRQAGTTGQQITDQIDADPAEVSRLRRARQSARRGKTFPRHSDTQSS
jgi:hypothetical protein